MASVARLGSKGRRGQQALVGSLQVYDGELLVGQGTERLKSQEDAALVALLQACAKQKDLYKGSRVHADILKRGLLGNNLYVSTNLVNMYAKCGALAKAQQVFDELQVRNILCWNALIAGYAQHGHGEDALNCFERMQREGISPDAVTYVCILKACASSKTADKGKEIHAEILREGLLQKDIFIGTALVDMYAKCGAPAKAQEVFDELPLPDVVAWNALITGYAQHGRGEEALIRFEQMQLKGFSPNAVTFICILKACGNIAAADKGKEIHAAIVRQGLLDKRVLVGTALVDMYAKCGALEEAQEVFDNLQVRDTVSWNVLIVGYIDHGHGDKALNCFKRMQHEGPFPDAFTFVCILKACGSVGAADKGKEIHAKVLKEGLLQKDILVGTALVDMYAKCGAPEKAQEVFDELPVRDVVAWTALIMGYAQHGLCLEALNCFEQVQGEGLCPDAVTLTAVLNACCHAGLLEKGQLYFETMSTRCGVIPDLDHFSCMVDLFGRAGHFNKAIDVIKKMPTADYLPVWNALLCACRKWGNVKLGRHAFECAVQLDEKDAAAYICMKSIYAAAGAQEDVDKIEAMRVKNEAWTRPGCCWWTDLSGNVHLFSAGNKQHSQIESILAKIEDIAYRISQEGHSSCLHWVSQDSPHDSKEDMSCVHSEKLAIACALVNTPGGAPICVVKDSQICSDCHSAILLVSKIEKRRFSIRDTDRFHVFENGKCTCGESF